MMEVRVRMNASEFTSGMRALFRDQIPYATSVAINDTAKAFQAAMRRGLEERFEIRRKTFLPRAVKIKPFAKKNSLRAVVMIEPPGGQDRAQVVTRHEKGGTLHPAGSSRVIPQAARRTQSGRIRKRDLPRALDMQRMGSGGVFSQKGTGVFRGRHRTFMIRRPGGVGAIFRRTGSGKSGTFAGLELLHILRPKVELPPRLEFYETAEMIPRELGANFDRAFEKAIGSADPARGRSSAGRLARMGGTRFLGGFGG